MPIEIETPDGVAEFPDGTPDAVIERVLREEYGAGQAPPQRQQRLVPSTNPRALPWQQMRQSRQVRRGAVEGALANVNRGIPFAGDVSAGANGVWDAGREAFRQTFDATIGTPNARLDPRAVGEAFNRGYRGQIQATREAQQQFSGEHPLTARFLEGTGNAVSVAPALASGGTTTAPQIAARTPGIFGRMGQGAAVGGAYGYGYGFGAQDQAGQPLGERMNAGNEGAAIGSVLGAAAPPVLAAGNAVGNQVVQRGLRPAWERVAGVAERYIPTPAPNSVGAMGANLRTPRRPPSRPPAPPQRPEIPGPVVNYVERNSRRERMTPEQLDQEFASARSNPQGQVLNDVFNDNGVRQLRPIVQAPGETSRRAAEVMAERNAAQSDRIINSLRRNLRVNESRQAAIRRLEQDYRRVSAENYRPVFDQRMAPEQRAELERRLRPYADDPIFQRAQREAREIFNRDRRNGLVQGDIEDNFARYAHYLKMGLDDAVAAAPIGSRGLQSTQMRGVNEMRARIVTAIDDTVPGYREARAQWGGLRSAEEALDEGAKFLTRPSEEVQARVAQMTPFELEHARIGMADALAREVGLRGSVDTTVNIANARLFRSPEMRQRIAALFETPEQAANFLSTLSAQNRLMSNAIGWNGGSSTYANLAHGDDNAAAAAAEGFVDVLRGEVGRAVNRGARQLGNLVFDNAIERQNNIVGEAALRRIDDAEAKAFTDELVRILREREASRIAQTQASRAGAAYGGAQQGQRDRN